jgi:uncharacterized protein (DUF1919 family)
LASLGDLKKLRLRHFAHPWIQLQQVQLRRKFQAHLRGKEFSFIASNCIGGRFSKLQGLPYLSPTVGLYFNPSDFLSFCEDLPGYLRLEVTHDEEKSAAQGYPVGDLGGLKIMFEHFESFDRAKERWEARASRVRQEEIVIIFTTRDGFLPEHLRRFNNLPTRKKLLFGHLPTEGSPNSIYVPGFERDGQVGDLYSSFFVLNQRRVANELFRILENNEK